ncbi:hypothetical protein [Synechococcus sp. BDU 130192]|uniref:hypothetical protein n=1 Tax=Synechococcus sp. BDU 130192 TaxID=2042059 RepID=UPI000C07AD8E
MASVGESYRAIANPFPEESSLSSPFAHNLSAILGDICRAADFFIKIASFYPMAPPAIATISSRINIFVVFKKYTKNRLLPG